MAKNKLPSRLIIFRKAYDLLMRRVRERTYNEAVVSLMRYLRVCSSDSGRCSVAVLWLLCLTWPLLTDHYMNVRSVLCVCF